MKTLNGGAMWDGQPVFRVHGERNTPVKKMLYVKGPTYDSNLLEKNISPGLTLMDVMNKMYKEGKVTKDDLQTQKEALEGIDDTDGYAVITPAFYRAVQIGYNQWDKIKEREYQKWVKDGIPPKSFSFAPLKTFFGSVQKVEFAATHRDGAKVDPYKIKLSIPTQQKSAEFVADVNPNLKTVNNALTDFIS